MYVLLLFVVIITAIGLTFKKNGLGSFVTLGIVGAAIYSIPALINTQRSLASIAFVSHGLVAVPADVEFVVLIAWLALLASLIITITMFPVGKLEKDVWLEQEQMLRVSIASVIISIIGMIYLSSSAAQLLFFLEKRVDQDIGALATLWKWTAVIGIVSASLARSRKLLLFHGLVLLIIFLRGDRTQIAIATAALIAAASYKDPRWYLRLRPSHIAGFISVAAMVFVGKSIYIGIKAAIQGIQSDRFTVPLSVQFQQQFEPFATFSHLEFVMRTGMTIGPADFFKSVFGNLLIVPSAFGISTNIYNTIVTSTLAARVNSGIAGNYMAHGYTVGGITGAALFYFILPLMLRLCDGQFRTKNATVKVFWCCVGAVLAFYIHRNGLDNIFSFVRQLFVVGVITAAIAAALRQFGVGRAAMKGNLPARGVGAGLGGNEPPLPTLGLRKAGS